jgi:ZIP family zinc transporter
MLGFTAGVMPAASLLAPAIEISAHLSALSWLPAAVGFALGGTVLWVLDKTLPHLHVLFPLDAAEGPKTDWRRATLLVTSGVKSTVKCRIVLLLPMVALGFHCNAKCAPS